MTKLYLLTFLIVGFQQSFAQFTANPFYPTSNASGYFFGMRLDVFGDEVIVASSNSVQPTFSLGKVYLFNISGSSATQTMTFAPDGITDAEAFGSAVCIQNEFMAIGAFLDDLKGSVYIYRKVAGNWTFFQKIIADDGSNFDRFGSYIQINNDHMFVSASGDEAIGAQTESDTGSVYVFKFDGVQWVLEQKLDTPSYHEFGRKIETENDRTIISSKDDQSGLFAVHSYMFNGTSWQFQSTSPGIGNLEETVQDFDLSDNQLHIISLNLNNYESVAQLNYESGNWTLVPEASIDQFPEQNFTRIKVSGDKMFIGSSYYNLAVERKFPFLFYKKIGSEWVYQGVTYGNGTAGQDDGFGASMALYGNTLVVGAYAEGDVSPFGKAYLIDTTLANKTFDKNGISLYPNPTNDKLFVKTSGEILDKAEVYSVSGKLLLTQQNPSELSLQNLASGMYLVKLTASEGQNQTFKIIKN